MIVNEPLLDRAREHAVRFLQSLPERHVGPTANRDALLAGVDVPLSDDGEDPATVLDALAQGIDRGLIAGAPRLHVVAGAEAHITIHAALRMLGLGTRGTIKVDTDEQGRMRPEALQRTLADLDGPIIVCAQAGNVNTGAVDPLREICGIA